MTTRSRLFDTLIVRSWWVILFILTSLLIFDLTMRRLHNEERHLAARAEQIKEQQRVEQQRQQYLRDELASVEDPAWKELLLMRSLGLVPAGYTKILLP